MNESEREKFYAYLEQYKRCYTMWINLNSLGWQVPTATFLSVTTIISFSFQYLPNPFVRAIVFFLTGFFSFLMMVQMAAHRKGLDIVSIYAKYLEEKIFQIQSLPIETTEIIKFVETHGGWVIRDRLYHDFLIRRRSYFWFQYALFILSIILWFLAAYNMIIALLNFSF